MRIINDLAKYLSSQCCN